MDENKTGTREVVKLSSCMWLGGADCMITTLNNIVTGGVLTYFFVNHLGMSPGYSAMCWLLFGLWNKNIFPTLYKGSFNHCPLNRYIVFA